MKKFNLPTAKQWASALKFIASFILIFVVFLLFRINNKSNTIAQSAKDIAVQNQNIGRQNQQHIDCIAKLFAKFTRDQKPINNPDLDKCNATEAERAKLSEGQAPVISTTPSTQSTGDNGLVVTQGGHVDTPTTVTNPPVVPPTPKPQPEPIRLPILDIPICVPDPLGLINGGVCVTH